MATKIIKTVCCLCGGSGCGMDVTVEDGKVVKVQGDKDHPESKGALCIKGLAAMEVLYSPDRLKFPLKRVGKRGEGKWERISWDEALGLISTRLQETKATYGPEAVCFQKGAGHDNTIGDVRSYLHRLANVFGTPNLATPFYNCYGPRVLNMFLMTGAIPAPDAENAECILLWGINPTDSSLPRHLKVQDAVKRGAKTHYRRSPENSFCPKSGRSSAAEAGHRRGACPGHVEGHRGRGPLRCPIRIKMGGGIR